MTTTTSSTLATGPAVPIDQPASPDPGAPGALTHRRVLLVFSGLMLGMLLAALDATVGFLLTWLFRETVLRTTSGADRRVVLEH